MTMAEDFDSPEAQARREAYYNRTCRWCGHAMGNHMIFSGCILCLEGCSGSPEPEPASLPLNGVDP